MSKPRGKPKRRTPKSKAKLTRRALDELSPRVKASLAQWPSGAVEKMMASLDMVTYLRRLVYCAEELGIWKGSARPGNASGLPTDLRERDLYERVMDHLVAVHGMTDAEVGDLPPPQVLAILEAEVEEREAEWCSPMPLATMMVLLGVNYDPRTFKEMAVEEYGLRHVTRQLYVLRINRIPAARQGRFRPPK